MAECRLDVELRQRPVFSQRDEAVAWNIFEVSSLFEIAERSRLLSDGKCRSDKITRKVLKIVY